MRTGSAKRKTVAVMIVTVLSMAQGLLGKDYFAAPSGSDANVGTKTAPFKTIQKAAGVMQAGDRCLIRAGTYRETVVPAHSGKDSAPITFAAFGGEEVVISGTDVISGPWQPHNGKIYAAAMPWTLGPGRDMVFVDGQVVIQARHPNTNTAKSKPPPIGLSPLWMTYGNFKVTLNSPDLTNPSDLNQEEKDYWKGALYVGWHGWSWCLQSAEVESSQKGAITVKNKTRQWWFPDSTGKRYLHSKFNQGYLTHHLNALDVAGEWHNQDKILYLFPPQGKDLSKSVVEAKRRHLAFDLRSRDHIILKGLRIVAASITTYNANNCVIDGCRMIYVSHYTKFDDGRDGYIDDHKVQNKDGAPQRGEVGVFIGGSNNVIKNSVVKYSAGSGLFLGGYRTTVTNCIIHDCGYVGTYMGGIFISYNPEKSEAPRGGHTITYNAVYRSGRSLINITADIRKNPVKPTVYEAMDISYNRLYDSSITANDSGSVYSWNTALGTGDNRTQVHHNLLWDSWAVFWCGLFYPDNHTYKVDFRDNVLWLTSRSRPAGFYKTNAPGDPKYFRNSEKKGRYDGGVEGLKPSDYPGGKFFKTGPTIQDEEDSWYP